MEFFKICATIRTNVRKVGVKVEQERSYIAIDLKSFYASVECVERGLDPLTTNLLVADISRTEKTICLAVSPSLKSYGLSGRARLFEAIGTINSANALRRIKAPQHEFSGSSYDNTKLQADPSLAIDYITAPPRMALYIDYSTRIYEIYLKYVAPEDIHVYSIDEVFIDATHYLKPLKMTAYEFAKTIISDLLRTTGITATAGIGPNLYLCKVAMDIVAKHIPADRDGVRIAKLSEAEYREKLWSHRPLTDFWRIGHGISRRLESCGLYTMGDVARCSVNNEALLYKLFGVNAELIIDHAWGWEPCTIKDVKSYKPSSNCLTVGQVLHSAYTNDKARLIVHEMADTHALDLVAKGLVTDQIVLSVGYDIENLQNPEICKNYKGEIVTDHYGRKMPKHAHGTINLKKPTSSAKEIVTATLRLFDQITDKSLLIRRLNITTNHVLNEKTLEKRDQNEQLDLFTDYDALLKLRENEKTALEREKRMQQAIISIKNRYGKNAIFKGMNLQEDSTALDRNRQIGGHKA